MNKIVKTESGYVLHCETGETFDCTRWYEKKTDAWHVKLPAGNPSGRTYVRESNFANSDIYEFETKTEHRTGLATGGWRAKMTADEAKQVAEAEALIASIKEAAMARVTEKVDPNSVEGLEAQIAKLQAKLAKAKA